MNSPGRRPTFSHIELIYDGDCPVCAAYVRLHRLREDSQAVTLTDARAHPGIVDAYAQKGVDLNRDFVLKIDGVEHIGGAAMFALSSIAGPHRVIRRLSAIVFRSRRLARTLYAILRVSRWTLLFVMGRTPIRPSSSRKEISS